MHSTKIIYIDCTAGISGDMMLGALIDVGVPIETLNQAIGSLGLPDVRIEVSETQRCGLRAKKANVHFKPEKNHRHLTEILDRINSAKHLTDNAKQMASNIFQRLGEAEATVHGVPVEKIHFHEVGAADSIADIVGAAVGFDYLGIERILASAIAVGSGTIKIAHGIVPVPAPATAELLRNLPLAPSPAEAELTTPTGAAILAKLASDFGSMPPMCVDQIGYGAGNREFESHANVVRLTIGQMVTSQSKTTPSFADTPDEYSKCDCRHQGFENLGDARVDTDRYRRCGFPEVVYSEGKTTKVIKKIFHSLLKHKHDVLATRMDSEQAKVIQKAFPQGTYNPVARTFRITGNDSMPKKTGKVAVVTAGTSDLPVAEEALETIDWMGVKVELVVDVGVAGPHRLNATLDILQNADVVVVVAGMEGALPSMVGGYVNCPVIAVPTSVGYGASLGGIAAMLGMLNSCASNVTVVNIDAGFKGGYIAGLIAKRVEREP